VGARWNGGPYAEVTEVTGHGVPPSGPAQPG
jgi:hypothetical protein